jgi:hypothetical protein
MIKETVIDILVPFYGSESYLRTVITSVLHQSSPDWRLIIINDCYPGGDPRSWIEDLNDERIHYSCNTKTLGVNGNFRKALSMVSSDYFVMMGGDDVMLPDYILTMQRIIRTGILPEVVQPKVQIINSKGDTCLPLPDRVKRAISPVGRRPMVLEGETLAASLLKGDWAYFPSLLWETQVVRKYGFREGYATALDLLLLLDIAASGGGMLIIDDVLFQYRRHRESASEVAALDGERLQEECGIMREQARRFGALGWRRAERAARLHLIPRLNALVQTGSLILHGKFLQARNSFRFVLR